MSKKSIKSKKKLKALDKTINKEKVKFKEPEKDPGELNAFDKALIFIADWWNTRKTSTKLLICVLLLLIISFACLANSLNTNSVNINIYLKALADNAERDTSLIQDFMYSFLFVVVNSFLLIALLAWKILMSFIKLLKPEYKTLADTFKEAKRVRLRL